MRQEHLDHGAKLSELLAACTALRAQPRDAACAARLERAAVALEAEFGSHLAREETVLFPAIARLPDAVQRAIVAELRARRKGT